MRINITVPNLPDKNVGLVLVKNEKTTVEALQKLGIAVLSPVRNPDLPDEVAEHADMLCFIGNGGVCAVSPEQTALKAALEQNGFTVKTAAPISGGYPHDIALNFAASDQFILGNFRYADNAIIECLNNNKEKINVKQGYAKCSTCFVTANAFITEDCGIAAALRKAGADVLRIRSGSVYLSEKHTGFFGGAAGKLSAEKLAINGSLKNHTDGEAIRAFLQKHGVEAVELFDGRITDIGGIIPLKEEV